MSRAQELNVTFGAEQAWRSVSRKCGCCIALHLLPRDYGAEVLDEMRGLRLSTRAILAQIEADGHDTVSTLATWERHRSGLCNPKVRAMLLGEADGVRRQGR